MRGRGDPEGQGQAVDGGLQGGRVSHAFTTRFPQSSPFVGREIWADRVTSIPMRHRYDVALLYLKQAEYDLDAAVDAFKADEKWERENPMSGASKGKSKQSTGRRKYGVGGGITGQVS